MIVAVITITAAIMKKPVLLFVTCLGVELSPLPPDFSFSSLKMFDMIEIYLINNCFSYIGSFTSVMTPLASIVIFNITLVLFVL